MKAELKFSWAKKLVLFGVLVFASLSMQAQATIDTAGVDSSLLAQQLMVKQAQQVLIDSLIRAKLNEEMASLSNDSKQKREMENQLAKMLAQDSIRKADQLARINALKLQSPGYAVAPFSDTLFYVYTKIGSFKAKERAEIITKRIVKVYNAIEFSPDSLQMIATEEGYDILYGSDQEIMSVTQLDAMWMQSNPDKIAKEYLEKIRSAVVKEREENSLQNWAKRLGWVALIIVCVLILIWIIRKIFKIGEKFLEKNKEKFLKGFKIRDFTLLGPEQQLGFLIRFLRILRTLIIILAVYLALPLLFSVFPETKVYANTLIGWVLSPAKRALGGLIDFLPNLFTIAVTFILTRYAIRAIKYFADELEQGKFSLPGFHQDWARPTFNIVKFIMYAFMVVIIFPYLPGSDSPAFQGISVFLGVLFSLGSSSAITNLIAGLVITYMRPFKIGDRVKIGEVTGDVVEKTMLVTRIRTIKNEDITVPNATVLNSSTINYSASSLTRGLILHTTITIGYDISWRKMHETLIKAAGRTPGVLKDPEPFVLQTSLDDFYVSYQLNCYTHEAAKQAVLYSFLHQHIQDCCNEAGIEILSPHFRAMRDGGMVTIPADYLPEDYIAPPIRVQQVGKPPKPSEE